MGKKTFFLLVVFTRRFFYRFSKNYIVRLLFFTVGEPSRRNASFK